MNDNDDINNNYLPFNNINKNKVIKYSKKTKIIEEPSILSNQSDNH